MHTWQRFLLRPRVGHFFAGKGNLIADRWHTPIWTVDWSLFVLRPVASVSWTRAASISVRISLADAS
jgi:hypothetical protein